MWKKTFKTIHQLSCFVGHPVYTCIFRTFKLEKLVILKYLFVHIFIEKNMFLNLRMINKICQLKYKKKAE